MPIETNNANVEIYTNKLEKVHFPKQNFIADEENNS